MRIAIMGAGLSGLSCAITLEKHGMTPVVFESRSRVGDRFVNGEAMLNVLSRPVNNCLEYFADKYDIKLKPVSKINKMFFYSRNEMGSIEGNLGITNIRGRHEESFETQLGRQVKSEIVFNSKYSYEDLKKEFSHVVIATGDGAYASQLDNYRCHLTTTLRGATIEGEFDIDVSHIWLNYDIAPKGYAYLLPYSKREANIVVAYPDYPENISKDINIMWERFYNRVCNDLGQDVRITDKFEVTRYIIGICKYPKTNNTYFVGNCFGSIGPALGFGQFVAILTGIYAAYDICGLGEYQDMVRPLRQDYENSLVIRRALEQLDDDKLDLMVKSMDNKVLDKLINNLFGDDTDFDLFKWISYLLRPFINK